jgi:hypothetical protein
VSTGIIEGKCARSLRYLCYGTDTKRSTFRYDIYSSSLGVVRVRVPYHTICCSCATITGSSKSIIQCQVGIVVRVVLLYDNSLSFVLLDDEGTEEGKS